MFAAVLFDFGGVLTGSPFDIFGDYERANGLEPGFLQTLNATNPDTNAWARHERGELGFDAFCDAFEAEAAAAGGTVDARKLMVGLGGEIRPAMIRAVMRIREHGLKTGLLTNNWVNADVHGFGVGSVNDLFDAVVASAVVGVRKPESAFYELACERLDIDPQQAVFLDDLGVNLKPARAMGMTTIKVEDPDVAVDELEALLALPLR